MVTELRVHGVGGSSPEGVLDTGPAHLVAGDRDAGFYTAEDPGREAYVWGNLTSGGAIRALWLLMLPFTLVNASFWMGPRRRANEAVVRLLALSLTATVVLAAEGIGTDLLGWQCAGRADCRDRHTWLGWLAGADPGERALAGAAVPLAVLALLGVLSRRTARYEDVLPASGGGAAPLEDLTFWYGARQVARLRHLHLSAGLAVIGLGVAFPLWQHDRGALRALDLVLVVVCWGLLVGASVALCLPSVVRRDGPGAQGVTWTRWFPVTGLAVVATAAAAAVLPDRGGWSSGGTLPGYGDAVTSVFFAQIVGVLVLVALTARRWTTGAAARGMAQPVFGALGLLVASVFSAGAAFRAADWLDGGASPAGGPLTVPDAYEWAAVALFVTVVPGALLLAAVVYRRFRVLRAAAVPAVRESYPAPADERRVAVVARTRALAGLTDSAVGWIAGITAACITAAVVAITLTLTTGDGPGDDGVLRLLTLGGTWLVSGFAALLIVVGYRSYRTASVRKTVGILWDIGTFWPRAAHPLAPPCYAERCVPDLVVRLTHHAPGGVVLAAHSQGSVLAAAVLWQLPADVLQQVRVVTHGSPLARLYGALYAEWFGPTCLNALQERVGTGRWVNLWRPTDPIGGPVGLTADRPLLRDPEHLGRPDGDPAFPAPRGHFDYDHTRKYAEVVTDLAAGL